MAKPQQTYMVDADYSQLEGDGEGKEQVAVKGCRDPGFAVLFLGTAAVMVYFATQGSKYALAYDDDASSINDAFFDDDQGDNVKLVLVALGLALFAGCMCTVWMSLVMKYPESIITCGYYTYIAIVAASCGISFMYGSPAMGVFMLIVLALLWCSWRAIKRRIPFAAANLACATGALNAHKSVMFVVIFMIILSVAWSITVALAAFGIYNGSSNVSGYVVFFILVAYYWGGMICANVSHVTIAGTVGSWWFSPPEDASTSYAVTSSFQRAMTSSFGSICFGSLLVAILESMKQMCREAQRQNNSALACCAACLIGCVESLVKYINRYAFVYVGLYGHDFCAAGSHVFELFNHRGWWDVIINDNLISMALNYGALAIGIVCGVVGLAIAKICFQNATDTLVYSLVVYGFVTGFLMACITANSVFSAVATVYVAFAESHKALQNNHPDTFYKLYEAWNNVYPQLVTYIVVQAQAPYGQIYDGAAAQGAPVVSAVHVNQQGEPVY